MYVAFKQMQSVIRAAPAAGRSSMGTRCGWEQQDAMFCPCPLGNLLAFRRLLLQAGRSFTRGSEWTGSRAPFLRAACMLHGSQQTQLDIGLKRGKQKEKGHGKEAAMWCKTMGKKWGRKRNEIRMGYFMLAFNKYLQHSVGQQMNWRSFRVRMGWKPSVNVGCNKNNNNKKGRFQLQGAFQLRYNFCDKSARDKASKRS